MSTSKGNSKINQHSDTQHRISPSKRTTTKHLDQTIDANAIIKAQTSSKPESGSEEVPLMNEEIKITRKHRTRHGGMGDYIHEDADEESTAIRAIMTQTKTTSERIHQFSSPSNNSAIPLQQQGTGDHYHLNTKQHRSRNRTTGKSSHQEFEERNVDRWRLFMSIVTVLILAFVIHRFLLAIWPKPKKTLMEQFLDDLWNFFTP